MFHNREDAALQLAKELKSRSFHDPLVLAIPRGGVVVGSVLARELGADLDIILARKLRAPNQPEFAIGAVSETGEVYLNPRADDALADEDDYLALEKRHQMQEIARRNRALRGNRPPARIEGRSVIVTDDGIATGSTTIAALKEIRLLQPQELIVAVPVAAAESLDLVRNWADDVVCLLSPGDFWAVGHYYEEFNAVEDEQVIASLNEAKLPPEEKHFASAEARTVDLGAGD
jgi:predicted phosphoribosyltransferase